MINHLHYFLIPFIVEAAVQPPPWANPEINPCATEPRGWQYIYWPPDQRCYKIFQVGYPCPETMELVPAVNTRQPKNIRAECRCPPTHILSETNNRCYEIFKKGPCQTGQYFAPQTELKSTQSTKTRFGVCKTSEICADVEKVFWPADRKCYRKHTQGPCPKGQLLDFSRKNQVPECKCSKENNMEQFYWEPRRTCYEHYTKGPCQENGQLFLPGRICDCHDKLPQYHNLTKQCYQLGSRGPCKRGHQFILDNQINSTHHAICRCKDNYILWRKDGNCYRPFTQGPCPVAQILLNDTTCIPLPCSKNSLYFPEQHTCYRIGSQGPCPIGQIVTFDFQVRPSIDGISHNGICGCTGPLKDNGCLKEKRSTKSCDTGLVFFRNNCYSLYTQGPCLDGQWLVPQRQARIILWQSSNKLMVKCECKPGFTPEFNKTILKCLSPTVTLANYLNKNYLKHTE